MHVVARSAILALLLVVVAPAASASTSDPKPMTLPLSALPTGYAPSSSSGYRTAAQASVEDGGNPSRALFRSWGFVTAYAAAYTGSGQDYITSSVVVYRSTGGAAKSLTFSLGLCRKGPYFVTRLAGDAKVGDEAILCVATDQSRFPPIQVADVLWRVGKLKGSIEVGATDPGVAATKALALARAQNKRM